MGSVGALGIGLSIVFGVFLVLLLAELYYLLFWKRKSLLSNSRVNSVALHDDTRGRDGTTGAAGVLEGGDFQHAFVAKMFENRGMMMGAQIGMVDVDGDVVLAPPRLLFTIKEETKEDLVESEDAKSRAATAPAKKRVLNDHVVVKVLTTPPPPPLLHVCSSSSSSSDDSSCSASSLAASFAEEDEESGLLVSATAASAPDDDGMTTTPFVTPPSSPAFSNCSTPSQTPPASPSPLLPSRMMQQQQVLPVTNRFSARLAPARSRCSYESPPSPPLVPMPVLASSSPPLPVQHLCSSPLVTTPSPTLQ